MNRNRLMRMKAVKWKRIVDRILDKGLTLFCWAGGLFLLWSVMQVFCFTSFKIPSDSMEPGLIAGDFIIVNKLSYGARLFNVLDAIDKKEIKIRRLPGIGEIERNDVVVFNFPYPARWDSIGFDVMKYYVKRCIALPGDTFEIRKAQYRVRGVDMPLGKTTSQQELYRRLVSDRESLPLESILKGYPYDSIIGWDIQEFGPMYIPRQGAEIVMNRTNAVLYKNLIEWEQKQKLICREGIFFLGDKEIKVYRFCRNYYFMAGDKTVNSQDSRYWGLLPEEFIVGKASFVWKSKEPDTGRMRWNRIGKRIE